MDVSSITSLTKRKKQREVRRDTSEQGESCQFIFWILVKEFKSTFIAFPLSSHWEENILLDLYIRAHCDNSTAKLMRQSATLMVTYIMIERRDASSIDMNCETQDIGRFNSIYNNWTIIHCTM